ncbi:hypothetical protein ACH5RR_026769 [Cinchona calisaya]|uniref:FAF domain-containing protein n=1 Tax=Cinchona calisaya TaxID=153742 RepID=A0ABD2Z7G5_9GENT
MREPTPPIRSQTVAREEHMCGVACVLSYQNNVKGGIILHACMVKPCNYSSPLHSLSTASSFPLSTDGNILGTDSGVHMSSGIKDAAPWKIAKPYISKKRKTNESQEKKCDIPPPLTILTGKGANEGWLVPWSLHREYRDGRLILREATTPDQFEYLETIKEDGRLISNLKSVEKSLCLCDIIEEETDETAEREEEDSKGRRPLMEE